MSDSRMALVLDLSAKVSEQETEIMRLNGIIQRQKTLVLDDGDNRGPSPTSADAAPRKRSWMSSVDCDFESKNRSVDSNAAASRKWSVEDSPAELNGRDSGCGGSDDLEVAGATGDSRCASRGGSANSFKRENPGSDADVADFGSPCGTQTYNVNPANLRKVSASRDRRRNTLLIAEAAETLDEAAAAIQVSGKPPSGKKNSDVLAAEVNGC
jgi:hypothetical protein